MLPSSFLFYILYYWLAILNPILDLSLLTYRVHRFNKMLETIYFISYTSNIDIAYGYGFIRQNIYRTQRCTRYVSRLRSRIGFSNTYRPEWTDSEYWARLNHAIGLAYQVNENIVISGDLNSDLMSLNNNINKILEKIYLISYTSNIDIAYGYGFIRQNIYRTQRCTRYVSRHRSRIGFNIAN
jgi:surface antigen